MPSEARLVKYISTNPLKRLCKADTEGGSIGGEAAGERSEASEVPSEARLKVNSNHNVPPGAQ